MEYWNGISTYIRVNANIGTYVNGLKYKRYVSNPYAYFYGFFYIYHQTQYHISPLFLSLCTSFNHNTKASHDTLVNSICQYFQITNYKGLVLNLSKIIVVGFMWMHNLQGCRYMRIFKIPFVLIVDLYFW